ncbi:MAG: hypothetical protein PUC21_05335 [Bacteroidales bacterium]|nr:hypothetical protein [Bacteroidales bacterium]MDY2931232.1 hypothetical protein [Muribaculaceae bacterium]MDD6850766.1 hypothetical protein [Bacteroidales bacterium]MDD7404590.1 hypothetical protein [Bacteroidales bacterium]MDY4881969.1 hypothetical protein [Muribaculaceae bacterium]
MKKDLNSEAVLRRALPPHAFHPNVSISASCGRQCYVAYPVKKD